LRGNTFENASSDIIDRGLITEERVLGGRRSSFFFSIDESINSMRSVWATYTAEQLSNTITENVSLLSSSPEKPSERTESFKDKPASFRTNTTQPQKEGHQERHNDR